MSYCQYNTSCCAQIGLYYPKNKHKSIKKKISFDDSLPVLLFYGCIEVR